MSSIYPTTSTSTISLDERAVDVDSNTASIATMKDAISSLNGAVTMNQNFTLTQCESGHYWLRPISEEFESITADLESLFKLIQF